MVCKKDMDNWHNGNFSDIDRHGLIEIGKFFEQEANREQFLARQRGSWKALRGD